MSWNSALKSDISDSSQKLFSAVAARANIIGKLNASVNSGNARPTSAPAVGEVHKIRLITEAFDFPKSSVSRIVDGIKSKSIVSNIVKCEKRFSQSAKDRVR